MSAINTMQKPKILAFGLALISVIIVSLYSNQAAARSNMTESYVTEDYAIEDNAANDSVEQVQINNEDGEVKIDTKMENDDFESDSFDNDEVYVTEDED